MTQQRALLAIHVAAFLFGLTGILGTLIQAPPAAITAGRALFAVGALILIRRRALASRHSTLSRPQIYLLGFSGGCLALHWLTFFVSIKTGGVAIATLGFASFPAFIMLGERLLFKDDVQRAEWGVLACISIGVVLITPAFELANQLTIGLLWGLLSGLTFALATLTNRPLAAQLPPTQVALWQNAVVLGLSIPWAGASLISLNAIDWMWMAILGVLCTAYAHVLIVKSMQQLTARHTGVIIALEPVYAIVLAALLFNQIPTLTMIIGGSLMIAAIIYNGTVDTKKSPSPE